MLDQVVREQLMQMLAWHIGVKTRFALQPWQVRQVFPALPGAGVVADAGGTYADAGYDNTWEAHAHHGPLVRADRCAGRRTLWL
jgi:hypothetical protein